MPPVPAGVHVVFDAAQPFASPAFRGEGGTLPDDLRLARPLEVSPGYAVSYALSENRSTLLAYLGNNGKHYELASPLAGRFHRQAQDGPMRLRLQNLARQPLRLRLYDLDQQRLVRETTWRESATVEYAWTRADYFVLVSPAKAH
jgi:hypothetical protein